MDPEFILEVRCDPRHSGNWAKLELEKMKVKGSTFFRLSVHEDDKFRYLLEGWIRAPKEQGNPRFSNAKDK